MTSNNQHRKGYWMDPSWITQRMAEGWKKKPSQSSQQGHSSMDKYEVRRHGSKWKIYEIPTNQYIFAANNKPHAVELTKNLNNGGGFNGTTPNFFKL